MTPGRGTTPRLVVEDLVVRYGHVTAVDHVDLAVGVGEVVALLGPSGCGKSSLLAAVAGLVPHAGRVNIDGRDVAGQRPDQRDLGLMFQDGALFPHLDVAGNVGFGLRMQGWGRNDRDGRVADVLDLVGLAGLGGRRIDALSGGQAQRVALARAIAPRPRLLLLDEPLSSLDARLRARLLEELPHVFAAVEAAVVYVTHDQDEAMAVADRVAVMDAGRIVRTDPPARLWQDPGSVFVAEFLGWANLFRTDPGTPTGAHRPGAGGRREDADRQATDREPPAGAHRAHLPLPERILDRLAGDGRRPAVVGVDAGRVTVVPDRGVAPGEVDHATTWAGRVVERRFAGDHVAVDVAVDLGEVVLRATGPVHAMPERGERVVATVRDHAWRRLAP